MEPLRPWCWPGSKRREVIPDFSSGLLLRKANEVAAWKDERVEEVGEGGGMEEPSEDCPSPMLRDKEGVGGTSKEDRPPCGASAERYSGSLGDLECE